MNWLLLYGIPGLSLIVNLWAISKTHDSYYDFAQFGLILSFLSMCLVFINQLSIKITNSLIGKDRERIVSLFKPLMYFTQFTSIIITLSCGFSVTATSFFLPAIITGYYFPKLSFFIALGAIYASFKVAKVIISSRPKPKVDVIGRPIGRSEAPLLWSLTDSIAKSLNTKSPERIILTMDENFCVTEANVKTPNSIFSGRSLILSLPILKALSKDQALGIIGHEMAHFSGDDTQFSIKFFPIFHDTEKSINEVSKAINDFGISGIAGLPAITLLHYFLESFTLLERELSRSCEKEADLKAAELIGHQPMVEGLVLTHYFALAWGSCDKTLFNLLHENGKVANNIVNIYSNFIVRDEAVKDIYEIINSHTSHPFHTHPSLKDRIEYLGETTNILKEAANWISSDPNILVSDIKNIQQIELELTEEKNKRIHFLSEYVKLVQSSQDKKDAA